jgi:hypothetical protein
VSEERLEDFMAKAARKSSRSTTRKPRPRRGAKVHKSEFAVSELFSPVELELFFQKAEYFQKGEAGGHPFHGNQWEKSLGTTDIAIANVLKENFNHDQLDEIVSSRNVYLNDKRMDKIETPEEWSGFLYDINEDYKRWGSPQERWDNPETPQSFVDSSKAMSKALNSAIAQLDAMPVTKGGPGSGRTAEAGNMTQSGHRPLSEIASEIRRDWGSKVFFGAKPYLDAMGDLNDIADKYGLDSAKSIVNYFLANASTWRGDKAKEIKAELKKIVR